MKLRTAVQPALNGRWFNMGNRRLGRNVAQLGTLCVHPCNWRRYACILVPTRLFILYTEVKLLVAIANSLGRFSVSSRRVADESDDYFCGFEIYTSKFSACEALKV